MPLGMIGRLALAGALLVMGGCSALLPSSKETVESPWKSFDEAKAAYEKIIPGITTMADLTALGFDPIASPNLQILTYLDIAGTVQSIPLDKLDEGLQECLRARINCRAYVFEPKRLHTKRVGNFWLDFFNFRRISSETGWRFKALLVLVDGHVTYKLWSGSPRIEEMRDQRNPLGPFQGAHDLLFRLL